MPQVASDFILWGLTEDSKLDTVSLSKSENLEYNTFQVSVLLNNLSHEFGGWVSIFK